MADQPKYRMTISRLTVDKLGVKLYDKVSAVMAEMVANSYDADATSVVIAAPVGELLATKARGKVKDKGFTIEVADNGIGMTVEEVNSFYLVVGGERRNDPKRGDRSKVFKRRVMGRKGVGKLAPFGVCQVVEVITAGGSLTTGKDVKGKIIKGYMISHLILRRDNILSPTDNVYNPSPGGQDGLVQKRTGTIIRLSDFDHRFVPSMDDFERQLSQRFGLRAANWKLTLVDSRKSSGDIDHKRVVGDFKVEIKRDTKISFKRKSDTKKDSRNEKDYEATDPGGKKLGDLSAGFTHEGVFYPVTGWAGYSKKPYKDDLMAGVRIYCRGKIACQTKIFEMSAGFTGEHDIRSYLIGELNADWLDESEDLIRTDRQDILWSSDLGTEFQKWGQQLVRRIGSITREPMRQSAWEQYVELSKIDKLLLAEFPNVDHKEIRDNAIEIAQKFAKAARRDELEDPEQVQAITQLSILLAPHLTLDDKLKEAANNKDRPISAVIEILKTARVAELSSFGKIADDRVKNIENLEKLKDTPKTVEAQFQKLLQEAPWLINPNWSPITANQSFETLKKEFIKFYKKQTGSDLVLTDFSDPKKRSDFVLSNENSILQLIEIKMPEHALQNVEMERIQKYKDLMSEFLNAEGNEEFKNVFRDFHITLVCDKTNLKGTTRQAFEGLKKEGLLTHITWQVFLLRTKRMHQDFLVEAERQKLLNTDRKK